MKKYLKKYNKVCIFKNANYYENQVILRNNKIINRETDENIRGKNYEHNI